MHREIGHSKVNRRGMPLDALQNCFSSYDTGMYSHNPRVGHSRPLLHHAASTLLLDIRTLNDLIDPIPLAHQFRDPRLPESTHVRTADAARLDVSGPAPAQRMSRRFKFLKALAGALLSIGICDPIDDICKDKLGIVSSLASVGISRSAQTIFSPSAKTHIPYSIDMATTLVNTSTPRAVWQISPEHTASRLLALITVLRGFLAFDGTVSNVLSANHHFSLRRRV